MSKVDVTCPGWGCRPAGEGGKCDVTAALMPGGRGRSLPSLGLLRTSPLSLPPSLPPTACASLVLLLQLAIEMLGPAASLLPPWYRVLGLEIRLRPLFKGLGLISVSEAFLLGLISASDWTNSVFFTYQNSANTDHYQKHNNYSK